MGLEIEHKGRRLRLTFARRAARGRTFPDTICRLEIYREHIEGRTSMVGWEPLLSTEVGCFPTDPYSKEEGRRAALRKLTGRLAERDLAIVLLKAYFNRPRPKDPKALRLQIERLTEELKEAVAFRGTRAVFKA